MPSVFGKENKKRELIDRLPEIYIQLQREYQISAGDFPEVKAMQVLGAGYSVMGGGGEAGGRGGAEGYRGTAILSGWSQDTHGSWFRMEKNAMNSPSLW